MNSLEDDDGCSFDCWRDVGALVQGEVVGGDLTVFAWDKLVQFLVCKVEVECLGVIEVVVGSVFVLIIATEKVKKVWSL